MTCEFRDTTGVVCDIMCTVAISAVSSQAAIRLPNTPGGHMHNVTLCTRRILAGRQAGPSCGVSAIGGPLETCEN